MIGVFIAAPLAGGKRALGSHPRQSPGRRETCRFGGRFSGIPALDEHGGRREADEGSRADRRRMDGKQGGKREEQSHEPAGSGAPECNGGRQHGHHPAQYAGDKRDRGRIADEGVPVDVLDRIGHRRLFDSP
jgi:hypothetical protein